MLKAGFSEKNKAFLRRFDSLRIKVILIYIVLTVIPLSIINISVYSLWGGMEMKSVTDYNRKYLSSGREALETELNEMSKINTLFNTSTEMQNLLLDISVDESQYDYKVLKSQWFFIPLLTTLKSNNSSIYSFTFFGTNDRVIFSSAYHNPDYSPKNEQWYDQIREANGAPVLFGSHKPYYDSSRNIPVISIGQEMKSFNSQEPIGVTLVDYNLTLFREKCFSLRYNDDSRVLLTNADGSIIYDTDELSFDRNINDGVNKKINAGGSGYFFDEFEGVRSIIIFDTVGPNGWKLVSVVPRDKIELPIKAKLRESNITVFSVILLISLFSLLLFNRQLKPLKSVAALMRKNVENNFKQRIETPKSNDEIAVLCRSFNVMTGRIEQLIEQEYNAKLRQKEAELAALEAQINPHFLYNTLETIRWIAVRQSQENIATAIYALSSNLRYSIIDPGAQVAIRDEVNWLKNYLYIQSIRFKNRFEAYFGFEEAILDLKLHKLLLQPFIENSILHGFENMTSGGILRINGCLEEGGVLKFEIADNGCGFGENPVDILMNTENMGCMTDIGIGINNALNRIALYYYGRFEVRIRSGREQGTSVEIAVRTGEGAEWPE